MGVGTEVEGGGGGGRLERRGGRAVIFIILDATVVDGCGMERHMKREASVSRGCVFSRGGSSTVLLLCSLVTTR